MNTLEKQTLKLLQESFTVIQIPKGSKAPNNKPFVLYGLGFKSTKSKKQNKKFRECLIQAARNAAYFLTRLHEFDRNSVSTDLCKNFTLPEIEKLWEQINSVLVAQRPILYVRNIAHTTKNNIEKLRIRMVLDQPTDYHEPLLG